MPAARPQAIVILGASPLVVIRRLASAPARPNTEDWWAMVQVGARMIVVERYRRLVLGLRFGQAVLHLPEHSHRKMGRRPIGIALKSFSEQLLRAGRVLLQRGSPSLR